MTTPVLLVTGSSRLIGSEVATHFDALGWHIHGVDNNQRAAFFGPAGDTRWNQARLAASLRSFTHHELDIRDRAGVLRLVAEIRPTAIVHTAAQPSHDRAASIPFDDFDTNAVGTLNLLEAAARWQAEVVILSTSRVYSIPVLAALPLVEQQSDRGPAFALDPAQVLPPAVQPAGITEAFSTAAPVWLYGATKLASETLAVEYAHRHGTPCVIDRCGWWPRRTLADIFAEIAEKAQQVG